MAIAFIVSWVSWLAAIGLGGSAMTAPAVVPYLLGAFGPSIAAGVIRIRRARRGEPAPEHAVRFGRKTLLWAPLLLVMVSATVVSAALLAHLAGGAALNLQDAKDAVRNAGGPAAFLLGMVIAGPLSEEPGWRGTAYPRMRASMGRVQAGLVLGVLWAVWHLPLFFIHGTVQHRLGLNTPSGALFAVSVIPMAMLTAYAYDRAGVVASMAVHFAANTTMVLLGVIAPVTLAVLVGIQAILAALLLAGQRFSPNKPTPSALTPSEPRAEGATRA